MARWACFGSALKLVAARKKVRTGAIEITAKVSLGDDGGLYRLAVELQAHLPEVARDEAEALMKAAHEVCPYSNATRGNVDVALRLV